MMAVWFSALLLVSIVPAVAPPAAANHAEGINVAGNLLIGPAFSEVSYSGELVKPGTRLSFRLNVTWGESCTNSGPAGQPGQESVWAFTFARIDARLIGAATDNTSATYVGNDGMPGNARHVIWNLTAATALAASEANAEGLDKKLPYEIELTCLGTDPVFGTDRVVEPEHETPGMTLDTKKPTITITSQPTASHVNAVERQSVGDASIAAIGSDILYAVSVNDDISNLSIRAVELTSVTDFIAIPGPTGTGTVTASGSIPVKEAGIQGYAARNGENVKFTIHAVDDAGNIATDLDTSTILVDNVRPPETTDFRADQAFLNLAPGTDASYVKVHWDSTAPAQDVEHARVKLVTNEHPGGMYAFASPTEQGAAFPLTFANPYSATVNVTLTPIDAAGNIRNTTAANASPPFVTGINTEYGGIAGQPFAVTGNGIRNLYVNVSSGSSGLAPVPIDPPCDNGVDGCTQTEDIDPRVFGMLIRNASGSQLRYWENGCAGSDATNHFQLAATIDTSVAPACTDATTGKNTAFRPHVVATTANPIVSTQGTYVFTNLSSITGATRSFLGGNYQLWLNMTTPGGARTNVVRHFAIDGTAPAFVPHGSGVNQNANFTTGAGLNWSDVHGRDGNPLRVYAKVQDGRIEAVTGILTDSKLRNVTFELIDPVTFEVVHRTGVTDDPATTDVDERDARVDFNLTRTVPNSDPRFSYFYDFRGLAQSANTPTLCQSTTDFDDDCIWYRVSRQNNWSMSWFNETNFSGWVNLTYPDLPAGKFKVRVLAFDRASGALANVYGTGTTENDFFKVAPAAKVKASTDSPFLRNATGGGHTLDVVALASQRYTTTPADIALDCVDDPLTTGTAEDLCPPSFVHVYVSPTNGAADVGELYTTRSVAGAFVSETGERGWDGSYVPVTSRSAGNGTLAFRTDLTRGYFEFTDNTPPLLPTTIDVNADIYVRVAAVYADANGDEIMRGVSDWVKVVSPLAPTVRINQPASEWTINVTSLNAAQERPPFNITFDRRADPNAPHLNYSIVNRTTGAIVAWNDDLAFERHYIVAGSNVTSWTGTLTLADGADADSLRDVLPEGAYELRVRVYEGTTTLAVAFRNFTILATKPTVEIDAVQPSATIKALGDDWVALPTFDVAFTIDHSEANLTDLSQLSYTLRRTPPAGEPALIDAGEFGFQVTTRADTPLDPGLGSTRFTATVTLPESARDGNTMRLGIFAQLDVEPFAVGASSEFADIIVDKQEPTAGLHVDLSEDSVFAFPMPTSSPPMNDASPAPKFIGFAEDAGSGVTSVRVRVVDLTLNKTLNWLSSGQIAFDNGISNAFATSPSRVTLGAPSSSGSRTWTLDVSSNWANDESKAINISHKYRVDVIARDALGHESTMSSTEFDFDAAPPFLGYSGKLDTTSLVQSGILLTPAAKRTINWHGSGGDSLVMTVNVTDNRCLKAVRLVGVSEHAPGVNVTANMAPVSGICPSPSGSKLQYSIDLGRAVDVATGVPVAHLIGNYTFWWEAEDQAGQVTTLPESFRTLKIEVLDKSPAVVVGNPTFDPAVGQAGGRTIVRADVFDNAGVEKVDLVFRTLSGQLVKKGPMRLANESTPNGVGLWVADTTDDLGLDLNVGEYKVEIIPYDIHWNRSAAEGGPTCSPELGCLPSGNAPIYVVRDDGPPAVSLVSPDSETATLNATPVIRMRAQHKNLEIGHVSVRVATDGNVSNLTAVPTADLDFTELKSSNGTRQGWTVTYSPDEPLPDNATLILNVTASLASLSDSRQFSFRVDAAGPEVNASVTGTRVIANTTWASSGTRVALLANDTVSIPTILYKVNGGAQQTYTSAITPGGGDGLWSLEYWATDPAGNVAATKTLAMNLDTTGPRVSVSAHGDNVLVLVNDGSGVGVNDTSVTVHYRYGEATAFTPRVMDKVAGNSFGATLPGDANETGLEYYFTALDLLGNSGGNYSAAAPYSISPNTPPVNLPPTVAISSPTAGETIGDGSVELRWIAEDPEEAPLTITISIRQPAPGRVLVAAGENSGTYTLDTSDFEPGAYTLVVLASDGEQSESAQVTFNVEVSKVIVPKDVPPSVVASGTPVGLGVEITPVGKQVASASYRLLLNGQQVGGGGLTPAQGVYRATFTPADPGNYTVQVQVIYTDGSSDPPSQVATFSVPGVVNPPDEGGAGIMPTSLIALLAIAVLTVALAAYGAFGRWKK